MADGRLGKGNLGDNEEGDEKENEKPKCRNGDDETPTREAETAKQRGGSPQRRIVVYSAPGGSEFWRALSWPHYDARCAAPGQENALRPVRCA